MKWLATEKLENDESKVGWDTLVAGLDKAGFVILATSGIFEGIRNREDQLNGLVDGAQRARNIINGIKWLKSGMEVWGRGQSFGLLTFQFPFHVC